ncbi:hypothetical protein BJY00DRAFT_306861 [Aspergillus carlsbadensis]|nr:hypothetical protein BJY00DRAFT_306861 [Aspergillus carlsbadensis]
MSTQQNNNSNQVGEAVPANWLGNEAEMWAVFDRAMEEWRAGNDAAFDEVSFPDYDGPSMSPPGETIDAGSVATPGPATQRPMHAVVRGGGGLPRATTGFDQGQPARSAEDRENPKGVYAATLGMEFDTRSPEVQLQEVMERLHYLQIEHKQVQKRLNNERARNNKLRRERYEHQTELSETLDHLVEVEEMNLEWQDKYKAAQDEVRRLQQRLASACRELSRAKSAMTGHEAGQRRV